MLINLQLQFTYRNVKIICKEDCKFQRIGYCTLQLITCTLNYVVQIADKMLFSCRQ